MLPHELIRKKRDGKALTEAELLYFIRGVTDGSIPDYQAAAMLMAIFFRGLSDAELGAWTDAMVDSGEVIDLSHVPGLKIDKHSTGGVGDKISLPLAGAVAACGVSVPMVSGRGLGHTGGTLDKLESIPGFRVDLDDGRFKELVARVGAALIGPTATIAPADRKLYALRDVTATVESIPLIASSIMSKKLAEGIDGLVLDCKVGRGAFMKTIERARLLASTIQAIGKRAGKAVTVVLSRMDEPIGRQIGNALEVEESIAVLRNGGPKDTRELTIALGAEMLILAKISATATDGRTRIERVLASGQALAKFREIVAAQGGDERVCDEPERVLPRAPKRHEVLAPHAGAVSAIDAEAIGMAALVLGGGRRRKEDAIDPAVGITLLAKVGERVAKGQPLALLHFRGDESLPDASARTVGAFEIAESAPVPASSLIIEVIR